MIGRVIRGIAGWSLLSVLAWGVLLFLSGVGLLLWLWVRDLFGTL